ncbi:MAG: 2-oxo acid dehydrogenase subunit E2, partial [Chloroflexota bacterium]
MRQVIAQRLTSSVTTAPHFFVTVSVDMTDLGALRAELKKKGAAPSFNDFVLRAVALSLQEFPEVNSTTDGRTIRWNSRIHLGLAVNI